MERIIRGFANNVLDRFIERILEKKDYSFSQEQLNRIADDVISGIDLRFSLDFSFRDGKSPAKRDSEFSHFSEQKRRAPKPHYNRQQEHGRRSHLRDDPFFTKKASFETDPVSNAEEEDFEKSHLTYTQEVLQEEKMRLEEAEKKRKEEEKMRLEEAEKKRKEEEKMRLEEAEKKRKEEEKMRFEEAEKKRKEEEKMRLEEAEKKRKEEEKTRLEEAEKKRKEEEKMRFEEMDKKRKEEEKMRLEEAEKKRKEDSFASEGDDEENSKRFEDEKEKKHKSKKSRSREIQSSDEDDDFKKTEKRQCAFLPARGKHSGIRCEKFAVKGSTMCSAHKKKEQSSASGGGDSIHGICNAVINVRGDICRIINVPGKNVCIFHDMKIGKESEEKVKNQISQKSESSPVLDKKTTPLYMVKHPLYGVWYHKKSGFTLQSQKNQVVVARIVDGQLRALTEEDKPEIMALKFQFSISHFDESYFENAMKLYKERSAEKIVSVSNVTKLCKEILETEDANESGPGEDANESGPGEDANESGPGEEDANESGPGEEDANDETFEYLEEED